MKEKERVKEMNEIIEMERNEEAKREEKINEIEDTFQKSEADYNAKINEMENEILEEQDRVGVFGNSGSKN